MKFFDYCATKYAIINKQMQVDNLTDKFDLKKQAQTKATQELIEVQRKWFKFWAKAYFVFNYFYCAIFQAWPELPNLNKPEVSKPVVSLVPDGQEARN